MARKPGFLIYALFEGLGPNPQPIRFTTHEKAWRWRINFPCIPQSGIMDERNASPPDATTLQPAYHPILCPNPA